MSRFKHCVLTVAIAFATAFATAVSAAAALPSDLQLAAADYQPSLGVMVVTATRTDLDQYNALAPVDVIDRDKIERLQSTTFIDTVQQSPGVDFSTAGGPGSASSLYLRGTNDKHTLILLDSQRIGSATTGLASIEQLQAEMIGRVEIVRGPRASLYGADAIGGVVQVFTRQPGDKLSAYAKAGYGSNNSTQVAFGGDTRLGALRVGAYLNHYDTQGIDNLVDDRPPNDDDDAYRNSSGLFKLGYDFGNGGALDLGHFASHSEAETDSTSRSAILPQPYNRHWLESTQLQLRTPVAGIWHTTASIGRMIDDDDQFNERSATPDTPTSHFRTTRESASWQNDLIFNEQHTATLGVDYYEERVDTSGTFRTPAGTEVDTRDNTGYFAQYLYGGRRFDLQVSLREDDNSAYHTETTGNVAVGIHLGARHRLIVSWGEAYKAPTFNDLYWPLDSLGYIGNPDLKSESSENHEIELRGDYSQDDHFAALRWSLAAYRNDVDNLIQWARISPTRWTPSNVANAEIRGIDSSIAAEIANWLLSVNYSYIDAVDADSDRRLVNRAQQLFNVDLDRSFGRWELGASWRVRDERYGDAANTQRLHGFGLLDLRIAFSPTDHWQLQLKLDNVFDKTYQLRSNYNQEGAGWFATVTYRM